MKFQKHRHRGSIRNSLIAKLKYITGTVGPMWSTTTTQNNLFEHKSDSLAFKLLMLIIVKQLFIFNFKLTFVLLVFQPTATTSNWNKTQKRKHLYLNAKQLVWDQNVMLQINVWKEGFNLAPVTYKTKYFYFKITLMYRTPVDTVKSICLNTKHKVLWDSRWEHAIMSLCSWVKINKSNKR